MKLAGTMPGNKRLLRVAIFGALILGSLPARVEAAGEEGCLTSKINAARQAQGARALSSDSSLVSIARRHSSRMAEDQRYYHNENLRSELPSGWRSEGENVGWATDCDHMHSFFMNSPSHRKNILNPAFNRIGVGVVSDPAGKLWVTEVFVETSRSGALSTDSEPALTTAQTQPSQTDKAAGPPTPTEDKNESAAPAAKTTPSPRSSPKPTVAKSTPKVKERLTADKQPRPQSVDSGMSAEEERAWEEFRLELGPMEFDLEQHA